MRRRLGAFTAAVAVAGTAIALSAASTSSAGPVQIVPVVEHATTDTVIDVGPPGDSTGDLLTFHNDIYDPTDTTQVGTDQGDCIRIDPAAGSWECRWITKIDATGEAQSGSITVEGPFFDTRASVLAVTGATGNFRGATGVMKLEAGPGEGEYTFTFRLTY